MKLLSARSTALTAAGILAVLAACSGSSGGGSNNNGDGGSSSGGGSGSSSGGDSGPTGTPSVAITSPTSGASVAVTKPDDTVEIDFTVTNFQLEAPGNCPKVTPESDNCGHLHLLVDGSACTPDGAPYNNATGAPPVSSIEAILSDCPMVNGSHTVTLEMHHDDHSAITDSTGKTISASVTFTATGG